MMESLFAIFPIGLFGRSKAADCSQKSTNPNRESGTKRQRILDPPTPIPLNRCGTDVAALEEEDYERPSKRRRSASPSPPMLADENRPLKRLPEDVLGHCLEFLDPTKDRFAIQLTSRQFKRLSDADEMMLRVQVGGNTVGLHGIINEDDSPDTAAKRLLPFAMAGNSEALYM